MSQNHFVFSHLKTILTSYKTRWQVGAALLHFPQPSSCQAGVCGPLCPEQLSTLICGQSLPLTGLEVHLVPRPAQGLVQRMDIHTCKTTLFHFLDLFQVSVDTFFFFFLISTLNVGLRLTTLRSSRTPTTGSPADTPLWKVLMPLHSLFLSLNK